MLIDWIGGMKRSLNNKWLVGKMNLWRAESSFFGQDTLPPNYSTKYQLLYFIEALCVGGGGSYVSRMNFKTYCYTNFTQLNKECHWLILDCDTFEQLYPAWDKLQDVIKAWWKVA